MEGHSDASWMTSLSDNKYTSGWIFSLGGGAISWASKKETNIHLSFYHGIRIYCNGCSR